MAGSVKVGIWGGTGGHPHDIDGHSTRLVKIVICSGGAIDSLAFDYVKNDQINTAGPWGGSGGSSHTIEFNPDEYLINVSGTTGPFHRVANMLRSLSFVTNFGKYGPFGQEEGTPFSIPVASGRIVAFFGRSDTYLDALGIYLLPN